MRTRWLVTYDISDPARLRRVYRTLRGFGDWLQLSVFRCELSAREKVVLQRQIEEQINHKEDQVLFVDLGPAEGRGGDAIGAIGRTLIHKPRAVVF